MNDFISNQKHNKKNKQDKDNSFWKAVGRSNLSRYLFLTFFLIRTLFQQIPEFICN